MENNKLIKQGEESISELSVEKSDVRGRWAL